jgi:L-arabinokinase
MVSHERPDPAGSADRGLPALAGELLARIRADPEWRFVLNGETHIGQAPGRLDVMGGIADYTGSLVCQMPLALATAALVQRRTDRWLVIKSYNSPADVNSGPTSFRISLDDFYGSGSLLEDSAIRVRFTGRDHWAAYVAGIFWVLAKHRHLTGRTNGANICCYSNVPIGAGLSSSAALEVAALNAVAGAYHLTLDPVETAVLAQKVENQIAQAPCGIMDQMASVLGRKGKLLLLKCQPHTLIGYEDLPEGTTVAAISSGVKHSVAGSAYTRVRVAAFMAHAIITAMARELGLKADPTGGYLANVRPGFYRRYLRPMLPRAMSGQDFLRRYGRTADTVTQINPAEQYAIRAAAEHHIMENQRVERFVTTLKAAAQDRKGNLRRAGRLMLAAHASYTHRVELGCRETDFLVRAVVDGGRNGGFYGAKATGGGGGGSVAILMEDSPQYHGILADIVRAYSQKFSTPALVIRGSGPGASELGQWTLANGQIVG